jgi:ADP-ribose pyrophosphatase YjhB (NUDIX family)
MSLAARSWPDQGRRQVAAGDARGLRGVWRRHRRRLLWWSPAAPARRPRVAALPTADIVIFTIREQQLHVLLIRRGTEPYRGKLALPGGFVRPGESLEDTAQRELREETGLDASRILLEQVHTHSDPERDPRGRVITTAFLAIAPNLPEAAAGTDAYRAAWIEVEESLWQDPGRLAFDHAVILKQSLDRARGLGLRLNRRQIRQARISPVNDDVIDHFA